MNSMILLEAIGAIDDAYILSAQNRLGLISNATIKAAHTVKRHHPTRKAVICIAAVITMLLSSFTVAMATSEEFREAVFTFLGITQIEVVPEHSTAPSDANGSMVVEGEKANIGGVIEGTYLHMPSASHARDGLYMICTDEQMMDSGSHFDAYKEENGELIKLEEYRFSNDYTILGNAFHVEFEWVEYGGSCHYTYIDTDAPYRKPNMSGNINSTLFLFPCVVSEEGGNSFYTQYPVLIDLKTGELTDILAGTGAEELSDICNAAISEDLSKMLLVRSNGDLFYADLSAKKLYSVDELSGEHTDACSLIGDTLSCWVLENALAEANDVQLGTYKAWTIDLTTLERRELFNDIPATASTSYDIWSVTYGSPEDWALSGGRMLPPLEESGLVFLEGFDKSNHWGDMYPGSRFALELDAARSIYVIDLANGTKTQVEGYLWPDGVQTVPSPDGSKLLVCTSGSDGYYDTIGVLDFQLKSYIQFSRENVNAVNEHTVYWFDNEQVIIAAENGNSVCDYYVYKLCDTFLLNGN